MFHRLTFVKQKNKQRLFFKLGKTLQQTSSKLN